MTIDSETRFILVLIAIIIVAGALAATTLTGQNNLSTSGIILQSLGLSVQEKSVDWGELEPNETATKQVHAKNDGSMQLTLIFQTLNWQPKEAPNFLLFSSPENMTTLDSKQERLLDLTLSVSPNIEGINSFSFDIKIIGETA